MRYRPLLAGAAALALALSLTACGDDGDDTSTDTDGTESTAAETEDTTAETTTEAEDPSDSTEVETETTAAEGATDLEALLLTPEAVGETFAAGPYEPTEEPGPCGVSIDTEYPYDEIAGSVVGDEAAALFLQHEVRAYADEAAAGETFAAAQEAFSCGAETDQPGLTLGEVTDVTSTIGGDAAAAVEFTDEENAQAGVAVFVQVGALISTYQFVGPADSEDGPDPVAIVTANVAAIEDAVG